MNKNDLVAAVADATSLSKSDAAGAVDSVFDTITGALTNGDEVRLVGFGTFSVTRRAARAMRLPIPEARGYYMRPTVTQSGASP